MQIIEYFERDEKEKRITRIENCDWSAAKFLARLLKENKFKSTLGGEGKMIEHACEEAGKDGHKTVYLATDHIGFYEKYGFIYMENRQDVWGEDDRIYYKELH